MARTRSPAWAVTAFTVIAACSGGGTSPPQATGTYAIDCVGVLGMLGPMPATQPVPLAAMPYSGAPREKHISDLTDTEIGALCDLDQCLAKDGYRRACYVPRPTTDATGPYGSFVLETVPLLANAMESCYPTPGGPSDPSIQSRELCAAILRRQFGDCPVGPWEDCDRETASGAFAPETGPSCSFACGAGAAPLGRRSR